MEFTETADLIAHATTANPSPTLPAFRVDTGTGLTRVFTVLNNGRVGIGTTSPTAALEVTGQGFGFQSPVVNVVNSGSDGWGLAARAAGVALRGNSDSGTGVSGFSQSGTGLSAGSTTGNAVQAFSPDGYAGVFNGKVIVNGTFTNGSDRAAKANISSINPRSILQKVVTIPIQAWNYRSEPASIRHVGPMAQDFRAAFGLGVDEKTISAVDADGVALASIQALYQMMLEKDKQIEALTRKVERQQTQLNQVKRTIRRKQARIK